MVSELEDFEASEGDKQMALIDIDSASLTVRDVRSRQYILDAIRSYRAGAYRPAITSTWVALAYDLIQKYRELASSGDAEANSFIQSWDRAVAANQTPKLLTLERELIEHAYTKFNMFTSSEKTTLERLRADRHKSAHPAFDSLDELYEPSDEQTRTHIISAISIVLSRSPMRGRGIIETFSSDICSSGFPSSSDLVVNFVAQKYLSHMRPATIRNFGLVLVKSLINNLPPEWSLQKAKVLYSLESIYSRQNDEWDSIQTYILKIIHDDVPENRSNVLALIGHFPDLVDRIDEPTRIALNAHCGSLDAVMTNPRSFGAAVIPIFEENLVNAFEQADLEQKSIILFEQNAPLDCYWNISLTKFAAAGSFRGAELYFDRLIAPFKTIAGDQHLTEIFISASNNGQIAHSGGIPARLNMLIKETNARPSDIAITTFYESTNRNDAGDFATLWSDLVQLGWARPPV